MEGSSIYQKLSKLQSSLKVPKNQMNSHGGFLYRSKEDILEAAKPLCVELGLVLMCNDEVVKVDDGWVYVKATATLVDPEGGTVRADGWAREPESRKGMDASQITGCAASYAGKRALGNLLAIDDTADADAASQAPVREPDPVGPVVGKCRSCGARFTFPSAAEMRAYRGCCPHPDYAVE